MRRFLIFAVVAPPLAFVTAFWVMLQIANYVVGEPSTFDLRQIVLLPACYLVGLIPAVLTAGFDLALAKHNLSWRIAATGLLATR